jgi:rhamnose utilization protein RhaD (predicted bifunctional aldolase and dehydrogenase)
MTDLDKIVTLSHQFGGVDYVKGGGGNTSVKNGSTLWVKPSGTTLSGLRADSFVSMDRQTIDKLYGVASPSDAAAREELVKDMMAAAVLNEAGRPSVEAPLHNVFDATFVVHTHPALVNGLTCGQEGEAACRRLFPEALWVEYIDPGYTLCMEVRGRIETYRAEHGREPALLVLQNHGLFVAADTPEAIHELYRVVMETLAAEYAAAGVDTAAVLPEASGAGNEAVLLQALFGDDAAHVVSCGSFAVAPGPITPDHLVYARAFAYSGALTVEGVAAYRAERGYGPKVVVTPQRVYGLGTSLRNAELALELALDGAQVTLLAGAFGGIRYMSAAQREFIENWEVEAYRQKQV